MDESPPPRMVSPPPDTDNSGQSETDSSLVEPSPELPASPHSRESSQSCDVSTDKSGVFPESSEERIEVEPHHHSVAKGTKKLLPAGEGAQKDVTAGAVTKDSSTVEEEQPSCYKDVHKQEKGGNPAEHASKTTPQSGTKAVMRAKVSTRTDISRCLSRAGSIAGESASPRKDDPETAEQKTSKTEPSSTVCREETETKSGKTLTNVEAVDAASSRTGQPENEPAATAESKESEKQSSERGRWSIWGQYISHELSMPMRRRAPPEDVGPPVSYTAVGQRLLQIFRERQETAQSIARETSGETHAIMQEMLPELRVPGNRTIRECEQELEQSAATTSQGGEEREAKTDAPVSRNNQNETSRTETEAIADGAGKPLERRTNLPEESKHTASDSASKTAQENKQKLPSPAAARSPDHESESSISETVSQDRRNEPPQPSTTVPAHSADVPSQITAELPDYRQGQSSRSYIDPPPRVFQRQSISPLNLWPRKPTLMQSRTSAFSLVRKIVFEEPPPHLEEEATSSTKLPDDSAEPAMKAGPSVPRQISPLADSSEQKKTPVSLQRLGKRNVSSGSESTDEDSSVGPPASKRRAEDTRSAGESQDASDESMPSPPDESTPSPPDESTPSPPDESTPSPPDESTPSPPDESTPSPPDESMPSPPVPAEHYFRAIELAPASAASEQEVSRPVALRAPITAQTSSTYVSGATDVSGQREPSVGKLADCTSDKGAVESGDDCGSDVDMASPSSTPRGSKHQLERECTSPAHESESTKIADDNSGGANEPSGSESEITVVHFKGVENDISYSPSEDSSDSSEMSASGGGGAVARSGHGSSAVASNSSNTSDKGRNSRAESDTARSGAGPTSQDNCSEDERLTETGGKKPTKGSGDNKVTAPPSAEGAEGHEVLEAAEAPHSDPEVEAGDATADSQVKEA